jgi:hypothetical protein
MTQLILHPTDLSQWHALVNEAQKVTHFVLNETTESYLVFLLMRFSQGSKLTESVIALDFLEIMNQPRHLQWESLRDVGDKSLLFCGLFPGMAERRHVNLTYFSDMGQAAYLTVSELQQKEQKKHSELYFQLSAQFTGLQNILQAMRGDFFQSSKTDSLIISSVKSTLQ